MISEKDVFTDPGKIRAFVEWKEPEIEKTLRVLGQINYFRKFTPVCT